MLSRTEADLVKRDPSLPGLGSLLDTDAFRALLARALPGIEIGEVTKTYIRYKPSMNCLVRYSVLINNKHYIFHAKAHGRDAPVKLSKAMEVSWVPSPFGKGRYVFQEHNIVLSIFPNDRKLTALRHLAESAGRWRVLRRVYGTGATPGNVRLKTLQYKPERRFVGKFIIDAEDSEDLLLKFYTMNAFPSAEKKARRFGRQDDDLFPHWRGKSKHHRFVALQWLEGKTQSDLCGQTPEEVECAHMTGERLYQLHQRDTDLVLPERTADGDAATTVALANTLSFLVPDLSRFCLDLAQRLSAAMLETEKVSKLIHGDFYSDQVLINQGKLSLLDTDQICRGDPYIDVGTFLAHLTRNRLSGNLPQHHAEAVKDAFVIGYDSAAGGVDHGAVTLRFAFALFQLAHHPFRACEPDWRDRIGAIVELCDDLLRDYERDRGKGYAVI